MVHACVKGVVRGGRRHKARRRGSTQRRSRLQRAVYRSGRAWGRKNRLKEHRGYKTRERKDMSRIAIKPGERGWGVEKTRAGG